MILAASLGKKLGSAPRLLAALINYHLEPHKIPVARVAVEKRLTSSRWKVGDLKFLSNYNISFDTVLAECFAA